MSLVWFPRIGLLSLRIGHDVMPHADTAQSEYDVEHIFSRPGRKYRV
jgi:hypothetical protein